MKKYIKLLVFLFLLNGLVFVGCEHQPIKKGDLKSKDTVAVIVTNCDPDSVYFENTILPIIISNCNGTGCHNAIDHADGVTLATYSNIKNYIIAGNATGSKLYKNMTISSKIMPPSGMLSQTTLDLIKKWINQGGKNNSCKNGCDTTKFTYSSDISKIINNNCLGCHNTGTTKIGTYNELMIQVSNGKLLGTINHSQGFLPMPSVNVKLQSCEITKIKKWINSGAPNN